MPSGKTHDAITFLSAAPILGLAWLGSGAFSDAAVIAIAFVFGGLMFGPDLDTKSVQYSRWGVFRVFWFPYKGFFKHRSRWSHGLVFGTLFRVIYFAGAITVFTFLIAFIIATYSNRQIPQFFEFVNAWDAFGDIARENLGPNIFYFVFAGLWLGAASHTFTDMAGSYIKTGRISEFL
ncbi:MAG: metal-binding protein [Pyrinomonadaceae bacterium]|nr:metal-binding protein [Pyrinomonadaceae bacterium]